LKLCVQRHAPLVALPADGHSLGLKSDGTLVPWGFGGNEGQLNVMPEPNSDFIAIAAN
jgi:hypothetical protein